MKPQLNADNASAIADLQQKWPSLHDVNRASAVHAIYQAGTSLRYLAKALNCSLTLIRNLNTAAQAPPLDRVRAGKGQINTRELVRRSRAAATLRAKQDREEHERDSVRAAHEGSRLICDWLQEEKLSGAYGEQTIDEARRLLAMAEQDGNLPTQKAPPDTPVAEIISRLRLPAAMHDDIGSVGWYAAWLARWTYFAMPDSSVRHKALNLALDTQIRG